MALVSIGKYYLTIRIRGRMNLSSVTSGLSTWETVHIVMAAKPLYVIVGQPTTQFMNHMTEQMAKIVAAVETTAGGGLHGCLVLVLDDVDYK